MSATTKPSTPKKRGAMGGGWVLLSIFTPVAILMLVASQFPSMIDRRIQVKKSQERLAQEAMPPALSTIEVVLPDGNRQQKRREDEGIRVK